MNEPHFPTGTSQILCLISTCLEHITYYTHIWGVTCSSNSPFHPIPDDSRLGLLSPRAAVTFKVGVGLHPRNRIIYLHIYVNEESTSPIFHPSRQICSPQWTGRVLMTASACIRGIRKKAEGRMCRRCLTLHL